jgi:DNA-binding XRE family transcriptional regulator
MVYCCFPEGEKSLDSKEFGFLRKTLQKTQKQMAELLGTSLKAVQSFEQGWRNVPVHIERQMLFLMSTKQGFPGKSQPCWDIRSCAPENRDACPAWEFNLGHLCWFVNGTLCRGKNQGSWPKKMKVCRNCKVFSQTIKTGNPEKAERPKVQREVKKQKGNIG